MSLAYRQTVSDELSALIDQRRGPLSIQDFTTLALMQACGECPVIAELRAEIERLHQTIRATIAPVSLPTADVLSWD